MSEEELRQEAVRRLLAGESPVEIAEALGRTTWWVRKWVARQGEETGDESWALSRSRAPRRSPTRTSAELEALILAARERLVANPRAQYGSLAIQWELRRVGVTDIPPSRTIELVLARAGVSKPRRSQAGYVSKHVPYPKLTGEKSASKIGSSTPASQPDPGASLPGTLASPRTGLSPAGCRELVARLRHDCSFAFMASELLDARGSRLTRCCSPLTSWF